MCGSNGKTKLAKDFHQFNQDNPHVYELFVEFTLQAINSGRMNYSARGIIDRIRWYTDIETISEDDFKINNNWSPFYARMFDVEYPEYAGFFRNRASVADLESLERLVRAQ